METTHFWPVSPAARGSVLAHLTTHPVTKIQTNALRCELMFVSFSSCMLRPESLNRNHISHAHTSLFQISCCFLFSDQRHSDTKEVRSLPSSVSTCCKEASFWKNPLTCTNRESYYTIFQIFIWSSWIHGEWAKERPGRLRRAVLRNTWAHPAVRLWELPIQWGGLWSFNS